MIDRYDENLLLGYIEGELSPSDRAQLEAMLQRDPQLNQLLRDIVADRQAVRQLPDEAPGEDLVEAAMQQIERRMLLGDAATHRAPRRSARRPTWSLRPVFYYAATAAVLAISAMIIVPTLTDWDLLENVQQFTMLETPQAEHGAATARSEDADVPQETPALRFRSPGTDATERMSESSITPEAPDLALDDATRDASPMRAMPDGVVPQPDTERAPLAAAEQSVVPPPAAAVETPSPFEQRESLESEIVPPTELADALDHPAARDGRESLRREDAGREVGERGALGMNRRGQRPADEQMDAPDARRASTLERVELAIVSADTQAASDHVLQWAGQRKIAVASRGMDAAEYEAYRQRLLAQRGALHEAALEEEADSVDPASVRVLEMTLPREQVGELVASMQQAAGLTDPRDASVAPARTLRPRQTIGDDVIDLLRRHGQQAEQQRRPETGLAHPEPIQPEAEVPADGKAGVAQDTARRQFERPHARRDANQLLDELLPATATTPLSDLEQHWVRLRIVIQSAPADARPNVDENRDSDASTPTADSDAPAP